MSRQVSPEYDEILQACESKVSLGGQLHSTWSHLLSWVMCEAMFCRSAPSAVWLVPVTGDSHQLGHGWCLGNGSPRHLVGGNCDYWRDTVGFSLPCSLVQLSQVIQSTSRVCWKGRGKHYKKWENLDQSHPNNSGSQRQPFYSRYLESNSISNHPHGSGWTMRRWGEEATQVKMSRRRLSSWNLIHINGPWCLPTSSTAQIRWQHPRYPHLAPEVHKLIGKQQVWYSHFGRDHECWTDPPKLVGSLMILAYSPWCAGRTRIDIRLRQARAIRNPLAATLQDMDHLCTAVGIFFSQL